MRYYLLAGEASGDMHGANLIKALAARDPEAEFRAWGGDRMEAEGAVLVRHIRELAFMGFWEVLVNLRAIMSLLKQARSDLQRWQPDVLILIDYPGFNLRLAAFAKSVGIRVVWYISPQVWAWKAGRVNELKRVVDELYAILPFEPEFYARYGMKIHYVGHPLLDEIALRPAVPGSRTNAHEEDHIALLPGSRAQEIRRILPIMLDVARALPRENFALAGLKHLGAEHYESYVLPPNVRLHIDKTYDILNSSKAALVTSGTATLESALLGAPQVVVYRGNRLSYLLARKLVKIKYISLVNLILDQALLVELIQDQAKPQNIIKALEPLLLEGPRRREVLDAYVRLREVLGGPGASDRVARGIVQGLQTSQSPQN